MAEVWQTLGGGFRRTLVMSDMGIYRQLYSGSVIS